MNTIKSLTISNIRGYVEPFTLIFDSGKKLCIVYGENGMGKSTLCDAIELLGSGTIGSLDNKGLGKTAKYWTPAVGSKGQPGIVSLTTSRASFSASFEKGNVSWTPPDMRPAVTVLRRPQLLGIVTAPAAKRYESIAALVDVSGVEKSEQALANLFRECERDEQAGTSRIGGAEEILRKLFEQDTNGEEPLLDWAKREAERDITSVHAEVRVLDNLREAYERLEDDARKAPTVLEALHNARVQAENSAREVEAIENAAQVGDAQLLSLLESASHWLEKHLLSETCPLCESPDKAAGLRERVQERISSMATLSSVRKKQNSTRGVVESAEQRLLQARENYENHRAAFVEILRSEKTHVLAVPESDPPADLSEIGAWVQTTVAQKDAWKAQRDRATVRIQNAANLQNALKVHVENTELVQQASALLTVVRSTLERTRVARRSFVNRLLDKISIEVGRLYECVHPGEGLDKIILSLDDRKRASLDLASEFQTLSAVPPQAYFSDSHLDTLGLCVFIALAKQRNASETILVLDDVLASIDEPHVDRLIEMIYAEAQHFQHVIVTTHYRPWREKLRWGWLKSGQCQVVELARWTPNAGPMLVRSTAEIDRLRKLLNDEDFDPQAACGKAGVVLEALLDFLTELYALSLPRKPRGEWTLGDLLPAFGKKLRAALRVEHQDPADLTSYTSHQLGPVIEELQRVAQTRNLKGAHFNKLSFELLDSDAQHFATKVLELADLLVHPEHGWPRNNKSGSYWATAKDARRLHPLKEPT